MWDGRRFRPWGAGYGPWLTAEQWATLVDHPYHVSIGTRRNQRPVLCRVAHHRRCLAGIARQVYQAGKPLGYFCPTCIADLQAALPHQPLTGWE